ncbi:MAG: FAD-binding protein [Planctomycetota bacterium]
MNKLLLKLFKSVNTPLVRFNEPMNLQTTFRIGGPAEVFIVPQTMHQLRAAYNLCLDYDIPVRILGEGSNLLVSDKGIKGAVIKITNRELERKGNIITAGAGYPLPVLIARTVRMGLSGLEALAGIPGSLGGAVAMNAGGISGSSTKGSYLPHYPGYSPHKCGTACGLAAGKHGNIGNLVKSILALDKSGKPVRLDKEDLGFGYRTSNILKQGLIAYLITLELRKEPADKIIKRLTGIIKEKRADQPLSARSAGCVFKNPTGQSAGALIDQAGLKGKSAGHAMVSPKHANFIVNIGKAKASEVIRLINLVKKTIYKKNKIKLELEIQVW